MTWIQSIRPDNAAGELADVYRHLYRLYPPEYRSEVPSVMRPDGTADSIVAAHSLLPHVMFHIFSAHAELMSRELPLSRRQHEMIATLVSALNRCFY
jgi:hypothetical protein